MENLSAYFPSNAKFEGKNILITGGTTSIGRATTVLLAYLGARVFIVGKTEKEVNDALEQMKEFKHVYGMTVDLSEKASIDKLFQTFDKKLGKMDVLINSAGITYDRVLDSDLDDHDYLFRTNINSYLVCAHEAVKRMKENKSGHIINFGSLGIEPNAKDSSAHITSKSTIQSFSESLRRGVTKSNIKVTTIDPGVVATDMLGPDAEKFKKRMKAKEMLDPADIAGAIIYCLSQPARCNISSMQVEPLVKK